MNAIESRARGHAALGDPVRLAIAEDLVVCDRSSSELSIRHRLESNLLAHHLSVLEKAGLIDRVTSTGDRRRRYVRLRTAEAGLFGVQTSVRPPVDVLFVCTHNSARSQLAAALWRRRVGGSAASGGTHPAKAVHPGAVAAARAQGLDIAYRQPRLWSEVFRAGALVVTVCDRAHEELDAGEDWLHWSIPDPAADDRDDAFDRVLARLEERIAPLGKG